MSNHNFREAEALEMRRLLSSSFASLNTRGVLSVVGGSKNDSITVVLKKNQIVATLNGELISFDVAKVKGLWIDGFGGADKLVNSTALLSTLIGSSGNDMLVGGSGNDSLEGDAGTDTADYSGRTGKWEFNTPFEEFGFGTAALGNETDEINPDVEIYSGTASNDQFTADPFDGIPDSPYPAYTLHGNGGDDSFNLGDQDHVAAYGDDGNDQFGLGDDQTYTDSCYGGSGDDTLSYFSEAPQSFFDGGTGTDALAANSSDLSVIDLRKSPNVENVIDAHCKELIGNDLNNYLDDEGSDGATLIGGGGNDTLIGGVGDDSLEGDSGTDTADYSSRDGNWSFLTPLGIGGEDPAIGTATAGDETDQINADIEIYNGSQGNDTFACLEYDGLPGTNSSVPAFTLHGSGGDDEFQLGDGGNSIDYGDGGNDQFSISDDGGTEKCYGGSGDDTLGLADQATLSYFDGGSGTDAVNAGGSRQPVISIADSPSVEDVINAGLSIDFQEVIGNSLDNYISGWHNETLPATGVTLLGEGGNDTLVSANHYDDGVFNPASDHNSLNGGAGNDLLIGGNENDLLHGGADNDTIIGGLGADTIYGDGGTDTADYSDRTENLNITIDGKANDGAAGEKDNVEGDIENIIGGSGDDYLAGNPSANSLEGGTGNDTIWGGSGNDTLLGDAGHDQLYGQDGNDTL